MVLSIASHGGESRFTPIKIFSDFIAASQVLAVWDGNILTPQLLVDLGQELYSTGTIALWQEYLQQNSRLPCMLGTSFRRGIPRYIERIIKQFLDPVISETFYGTNQGLLATIFVPAAATVLTVVSKADQLQQLTTGQYVGLVIGVLASSGIIASVYDPGEGGQRGLDPCGSYYFQDCCGGDSPTGHGGPSDGAAISTEGNPAFSQN